MRCSLLVLTNGTNGIGKVLSKYMQFIVIVQLIWL